MLLITLFRAEFAHINYATTFLCKFWGFELRFSHLNYKWSYPWIELIPVPIKVLNPHRLCCINLVFQNLHIPRGLISSAWNYVLHSSFFFFDMHSNLVNIFLYSFLSIAIVGITSFSQCIHFSKTCLLHLSIFCRKPKFKTRSPPVRVREKLQGLPT